MKKSSFYIIGKHAVIGALKNPSRKVLRVFLTEDTKNKINRENQSLNLLKNVKVYFKTKKELDKYVGRDEINHQGFVAEIEHLKKSDLKEFINTDQNNKNTNLVALEGVTDPRNIGSIIRSAVAFDINGIIVKERTFPNDSKLMYKTASGCIEIIKIFEVSNINTSLKFLKTKGYWVSGFTSNTEKDFTKHNWNGKNVLLFGSEGFGLNYHTKKNSDFLFKININKDVESLNIANCASVVFHYIKTNKK